MATVQASTVIDHPELGADPIASRIAGVFKSDRLRFRGVELDDADLMFRLRSDPTVELNAGGSSWPRPYTQADAKEFCKILQTNVLSAVIELDPEKEHRGLAAALRGPSDPAVAESRPEGSVDSGIAIGNISLRSVFGASNVPVRTAELAINLLPAYHGRGYGAEAIRWILDWAFEMAGLHRVRLGCFSYNTQAIRAYEAVGFKRAGNDQEAVWLAGRWWDFIHYGLIDREWKEVKEERKRKGLRV